MSTASIEPVKGSPHYPPTAPGHRLYGVSREFQRDPLQAINTLFQAHGDAVRFRFFANFYGYVFAHPDHARHILQDNNRNYTKIPHPTNVTLRILVGNGLLTSDGDFWRRQRRLAQPAFHRHRLVDFGETMGASATAILDRWDHAGGEGLVDVSGEMMRLTLEIVGKTLFSMDITGAADTVGASFSRVNEQIMDVNARPFGPLALRLPFLSSTRALNQDVAALNRVVNDIITRRRASGLDEPDLLGLLMSARDEETGAIMDDRQLRDEVMTIMLAGHETTAVALSWTFYLLAQYPEAREQLEAELEGVLAGRTAGMADLGSLPYTKAVLEESMRLYPPAWGLARYCNEADVVGGYAVPAKSVVSFSTYRLHHHPGVWDEPERFDPDRFAPEREKERPRFAYLPFGGGPRQCIGRDFALAEGMILLAAVAQRYRLELQPGYRAEIDANITLRPKGGLPMRLLPRIR